MRLLTTSLAIVFALGAVACFPADFDDLADEAWVDSNASGAKAETKHEYISWAPRNDNQGPLAAEFLVFSTGIKDGSFPLSMQRYDYSESGGFGKTSPKADASNRTNFTLLGGDPAKGVALAVMQDTSGSGGLPIYVAVGDFGRHARENENAPPGDTLTSRDRLYNPMGDGGVEVEWSAFAYSKDDPDGTPTPMNVVAEGVLAAVGTSENGDELQAFSEVSDSTTPARCQFDGPLESSPQPEFAVASLAVFDTAAGEPQQARFIIGTDVGPRLVPGFPGTELVQVCDTIPLSSVTPVDGQIQIGEFTGAAGRDILAVAVGESVTFLLDEDTGVAGDPFLGGQLVVPAPAGASSKWGQSVAVGDFDDDGVNELAVGDPEAGTVHIFEIDGTAGTSELVKTLTPNESRSGFGKALASVPFFGGKDLLVVGNNKDVFTYFRIFAEGESDTDNDPR